MEAQPRKDDGEQAEFKAADATRSNLLGPFPQEIRDMVFQEIAVTPSLICLPHEIITTADPLRAENAAWGDIDSGKAHVIVNLKTAKYVNGERDACRELRYCNILQAGLSRSGYTEKKRKLAEKITKDIQAPLDEGDPAFTVVINGSTRVTPRVRREVDWIYMPGILVCSVNTRGSMPRNDLIGSARNLALDLADLTHALCLTFDYEVKHFKPGQSLHAQQEGHGSMDHFDSFIRNLDTAATEGREHSWLDLGDLFFTKLNRTVRVLHGSSALEATLRVLIGPVPDDHNLAHTEEVLVEWSPDHECGIGESHIVTTPDDVSVADKKGISFIKYILEGAMKNHKKWISAYLCADSGESHKRSADKRRSKFAEWLDHPLGRWWLETHDGKKWLSDYHSAKCWLSDSKYGVNWLDSPAGVAWLNTEDARESFLHTVFAQRWASYDREDPYVKAKKPKWFDTEEGRVWKQNSMKGVSREFNVLANLVDIDIEELPHPFWFRSFSNLVFVRWRKEFTTAAAVAGEGEGKGKGKAKATS